MRTRLVAQLVTVLLATAALSSLVVWGDVARADDSPMMASYAEYLRLYKAGKFAEAVTPAKRAHELAEQDLALEDSARAVAAFNLASLYLKLDRPADAGPPLIRALACYDVQYGRASEKSLSTQLLVGGVSRRIGALEAAERTYLDMVERMNASPEDHTADLARVYGRLRRVAEAMGSHPRVKRYGIKAVNAYTKTKGPDSLEVAVLTVELGRNAVELEDYQEAFKLFEHGVPMLETHLEPGDPQLIALYEYLVSIYEAAGDATKYHRYRKRLKKSRSLAESNAD